MFKPISLNINFPEMEEKILSFWKKNKIFEKSVAARPENKKWTFLDGPPFITGMPHYGTLLSSIPKDVFPRYWTMKGYRVRRVWGWDCHGLPAENKVETSLGLKSKREIEEKVGVAKFIKECKKYVSEVSSEWEWYIDRIARWVDFKDAYKTMDLSYMETVMWVFKEMYDKGYIYKGLRVSLYCPHCSTPISNFEVAMDAENYKDVTEPTAVYKYQLEGEPDTFLLAWSTTPWNKLATPALAVNPKLTYVKVSQGNKKYILAKSTLSMLTADPYKINEEFLGSKLVGKKFVPHYSFYKVDKGKKAFIVISGDFVTAMEGTGIVTIAAYGEEDLVVMLRDNIQLVLHVDDEGILKKEVPKWAGKYYLQVDPLVIEDLDNRGLIYRVDKYTHSVPMCWRCHTRLIYAPQNAWYINIKKLKPQLIKTNKSVNWFPEHFKYGRYQKSVESAPDWCISRSRYWGSPVPVWECVCGERFVPGSIAELEKEFGRKITDIHKPLVDEITIICKKCKKHAKRVPEVLDSWIEAGSASFAERHFPFDKTLKLQDFFPPDFIVEYTGQIRAWFYVLHVIATALFGSNAFKNVVVSGVILGSDGRKMSKNYGNYPDPKEMLQKYGGDALRLYLMGSPVMHGEDIRISEIAYKDQVRGIMLIIWNIYNFFITYSNVDKWSESKKSQAKLESLHVLDQWILSLLNQLIIDVTKYLESYDTVSAIRACTEFITSLSQWYIRRSRNRVGPTADQGIDNHNFYETLYHVLVSLCKILAPFTPFISEEIYKNLTGEESVHLSSWPKPEKAYINKDLIIQMTLARKVVEVGHGFRKAEGIKVRIPLAKLELKVNGEYSNIDEKIWEVVLEELNIKNIVVNGKIRYPKKEITVTEEELLQEGQAREIVRNVQQERKKLGCSLTDLITLTLPSWPQQYSDYIKRETLTKTIVKADKFSVLLAR